VALVAEPPAWAGGFFCKARCRWCGTVYATILVSCFQTPACLLDSSTQTAQTVKVRNSRYYDFGKSVSSYERWVWHAWSRKVFSRTHRES